MKIKVAVLLVFIVLVGTLYFLPKNENRQEDNDYVKASLESENISGQTRPDQKVEISSKNAVFSPYPYHKDVLATLFWVGEEADASNEYIANAASYWDEYWQEHYGGVDNPSDRCGFLPCQFIPKENPFYVALPYGEFDESGKLKENAKSIPWFEENLSSKELMKNRWVEVTYNNKVCYGQLEDVGPFEMDDFEYVFGEMRTKNERGVGAGIDLSPAIFDCLGINTNSYVAWRFIEEKNVPKGPWKEIITTSSTTY